MLKQKIPAVSDSQLRVDSPPATDGPEEFVVLDIDIGCTNLSYRAMASSLKSQHIIVNTAVPGS